MLISSAQPHPLCGLGSSPLPLGDGGHWVGASAAGGSSVKGRFGSQDTSKGPFRSVVTTSVWWWWGGREALWR